VSPVRYELGFYIPEEDIFMITAVKTSNLTRYYQYAPTHCHREYLPICVDCKHFSPTARKTSEP
jgi:hypothetical protein